MSIETENIILPKTLDEFTETDSLCDALKDPKFLAKVPLLNYTPLHKLKNHALVRFRGMIQDMVDPEIYLEKYEVKSDNGDTRMQCGKFRDTLVMKNGEIVNFESGANVHGERRTLFVVSIPGLNEWAQTYESDCNKQNLEIAVTTKGSENVISKKRAFTDEGLLMETEDIPSTSTNDNSVNGTNKRQCLESETIANTESKSSLIGVQYMLNSPIPERPSLACMVKIYNDLEDYILDTVIDAVGFLSVDPSLDGTAMDTDDCQYISATELHAQNPPPSIIPRLHAIAVHKLHHCNPLLDERILALKPHPIVDAVNAFKDLHRMLTLCLFNDSLAADYLISHLISTVYNRSEGESIGKFSLNIYNFPQKDLSTYTDKLYKILELLLPASHYLPMTLDNINNSTFVPKKDYETNKLVSGLLQLAPHTHLVLDETHMQQGQLNSQGVLAMQNIIHLVKTQEIQCDFQYYNMKYLADVPVLVFSEGKTMIPMHFRIPINTDENTTEIIMETLKAAHHYLQPDRLDQFRRFITEAKLCEFSMNPENMEMIQTDYVQMRKDKIIDSSDQLHSLLTLSRLLAIARGKKVLDKESWELAKEMEHKRRERIKELPKCKPKV